MAVLYSQVSLIFGLIINMKYTYAFSDEESTIEIVKK